MDPAAQHTKQQNLGSFTDGIMIRKSVALRTVPEWEWGWGEEGLQFFLLGRVLAIVCRLPTGSRNCAKCFTNPFTLHRQDITVSTSQVKKLRLEGFSDMPQDTQW